ncbi:MAG: helix-turn-helix domain-containing protein [Planctomycetes bacterium]|nr:helix-turn-helix domain-containing protein [Planctomycetota bacterium]
MTLEELSQQIAELRAIVLRTNIPDLLTSAEAATIIGVSNETMFRWRKDGQGPAYVQPTPRVVRYRREDVLAFIEQGAQA